MKTIFTLLLATLAAFASAQVAPTVSNESALVRLTLTRAGDSTLVTVASRQTCTADYRVTTSRDTVITLAADASASFKVVLNLSPVSVTPLSRCVGGGTIQTVTTQFTAAVLPIKFGALTAKWLAPEVAEVAFSAEEVDTRAFYLQHSLNGREWVTLPTSYSPTPGADGKFRLQARILVGEKEGVHYVLLNRHIALTNTVLLRKPIAGGVEARYPSFFLRVLSVSHSGENTYSPVVSLRTR